MQGVLAFGCLRAREDLAFFRTEEFTIISPHRILFDMKRKFKSHKITSDKKVVKKPSRFIEGEDYVQILTEILQHIPVFARLLPTQPIDSAGQIDTATSSINNSAGQIAPETSTTIANKNQAKPKRAFKKK